MSPAGRLEPFTMGKNLFSHFRSQLAVLLADLEIQDATAVRGCPTVPITYALAISKERR